MKGNPDFTSSFFTSVLQIIAIDSILVFLISWIFGGLHLVPDFFFFSSAVLLLVSIFPFLTEGGIKGFIRIRKKGEVIADDPKEIIRKKEERLNRLQGFFTFGVSGIIAFLLSVLSSNLL